MRAEAGTGGLFGLVGGGGAGVGLVSAAAAAAVDEASVLFVSVLLPLVESDVVAVMAHAYSKFVLCLVFSVVSVSVRSNRDGFYILKMKLCELEGFDKI